MDLALLLAPAALAVAGLCVVVFRQRTRITELARRLGDVTRTDSLTGLLNRTAFEQLLDLELERSARTGRTLAIVFGDIDGLAALNAERGHHAGDLVLQTMAADIRKWKRRIDSAARLDGEESALIV